MPNPDWDDDDFGDCSGCWPEPDGTGSYEEGNEDRWALDDDQDDDDDLDDDYDVDGN